MGSPFVLSILHLHHCDCRWLFLPSILSSSLTSLCILGVRLGRGLGLDMLLALGVDVGVRVDVRVRVRVRVVVLARR